MPEISFFLVTVLFSFFSNADGRDILTAQSLADLPIEPLKSIPVEGLSPTALPQNPQMALGTAGFRESVQEGILVQDITPHQPSTHILWDTFDVGSKAAVDFHHAGANYVTVNEVVGSRLSEVAGRISVDQGQVYILNPQGIVYHDGAIINGSVIMGTNTLNQDAFYKNGHVLLNALDASGPVIINGNLTIKEAGLLGIVAPYFSNRGHVTGELHVAGGKEVRVDFGDKRLTFTIDGKLKEAFLHSLKGSSIEGKAVTMTVGTLEKVLDETIRIDGDISLAEGLTEEDGRLILKGGDTGKVVVSGTLDASGAQDSEGTFITPGKVLSVTGHTVIAEPSARLKASGTKGGRILFGANEDFQRLSATDQVLTSPHVKATNAHVAPGAQLTANGTTEKGGDVVIISKGKTESQGAIISATSQQASGGRVEISGNEPPGISTNITVGADGEVVLDPGTVLIAPTSGETGFLTTGANISNLLNQGTNVTLATSILSPSGAGSDQVIISDNITWTGAASLTLVGQKITLSANKTISHPTGAGNLNLINSYLVNMSSVKGANNGILIFGTLNMAGGLIRTFTTMAAGNQGITSAGNSIISGPATGSVTAEGGSITAGTIQNFVNIYGNENGSSTTGPTSGEYWYGMDALTGTTPTLSLSGKYSLRFPSNTTVPLTYNRTSQGINWWSGVGDKPWTIFDNEDYDAFIGYFTGDGFGMNDLATGNYAFTTNTPHTISFAPGTYRGPVDSTSQYWDEGRALIGLFCLTNGATITSLNLTNVNLGVLNNEVGPLVSPHNFYLGTLVGLAQNSTINNISLSGSVGNSMQIYLSNTSPTRTAYLGGLCGDVIGCTISNITISQPVNLSNQHTVTGDYGGTTFSIYTGDAFGHVDNTSTISNITVNGNTTYTQTDAAINATIAALYAGSVAGQSETLLSSVSNSGTVSVNTTGGVAPITNLYIGDIAGSSGGIQNSTNTGSVSVNAATVTIGNLYHGALAGYNAGTIASSMNSGTSQVTNNTTISGAVYTSGLIGNLASGTITGSSNQGATTFTNNGTIGGALYYGNVVGKSAGGTTASQNFNVGNLIFSNSASGSIAGFVYLGGFSGQELGSSENNYSLGTLTATNANTIGGSFNLGGFTGSAVNVATSYTRATPSLTNTGTITGAINIGSFAGTNAGTIGTSYVLQSTLPVIGSGSGAGITTLSPLQMVRQSSYLSFNFGNIWSIQEWFTTPYFATSSYIPYLPGFELEASYLQQISKVTQNTITILHDHRTLIPLEDPLKSVSLESPPHTEGFNLFGHEETHHSAGEALLKIEEEEGLSLFVGA